MARVGGAFQVLCSLVSLSRTRTLTPACATIVLPVDLIKAHPSPRRPPPSSLSHLSRRIWKTTTAPPHKRFDNDYTSVRHSFGDSDGYYFSDDDDDDDATYLPHSAFRGTGRGGWGGELDREREIERWARRNGGRERAGVGVGGEGETARV